MAKMSSPQESSSIDHHHHHDTKPHVQQWRRTWHDFNRALRSPQPFDQWYWMFRLTKDGLQYLYHESRLNVLVETRFWRPMVPAFGVALILFCGGAYCFALREMLIQRWCCPANEIEAGEETIHCTTCIRGHIQTGTVSYLIVMILYHLLQATFTSPGVALPSDAALLQPREQAGTIVETDEWSSLQGRGGCCGLEPRLNAQAEYERVALYGTLLAKNKSGTEYYYPSPGFSYCKKCDIMRPPRCHHCSVCNRCILQMDHHCPWVNNCIGYNNYRSFVLTVFFLAAVCWYGFSLLVTPFQEEIQQQLGEDWSWRDLAQVLVVDVSPFWTLFRQGMKLFVLLKVMVPLLFGVAVVMTAFLAWHLFYIVTGRTTLEHKVRLYQLEAQLLLRWMNKGTGGRRDQQQVQLVVNPFDQGWRANMKQALGPNLLLIFLPVPVKPPPPFVPDTCKRKST